MALPTPADAQEAVSTSAAAAVPVWPVWSPSVVPTGPDDQPPTPIVARAGTPKPFQAVPRRRPRSAATSNVAYVESAIVGSQFQLRFDRASGMDRPDRAEFFYAKCGCYREVAKALPPNGDADAAGPAPEIGTRNPFTTPIISTGLDYQDITIRAEAAFNDRFSLFAEVPFRSIDAEIVADHSGLGDIQAGVKFALVASESRYLTAQMRAYLPTGEAGEGLGTDHVSFEPGLLYHEGSGDRLKLEAEARVWIPVDAATGRGTSGSQTTSEEYSAPVIRFGAGLGYDVTPDSPVRFTPVVELVAWKVTGGIATRSTDGTLGTWVAEDADADIVNLKIGARLGIRATDAIYVGYGTPLTDDHWYDDVIRLEYRLVP